MQFDDRSFDQLREHLHRIVRRTCPSWLSDQSEDIVQNALLRLRRRFSVDNEENPPLSSSFLWRTAHSVLVDEIRKQRRYRTDASPESGAAHLPNAAPDPESLATSREIGGAIRACLEALLVERRRAVVLRLIGHRVAEVAKMMGWSPKKADNLVYRGFADLRRCLQSKGFQP